MGKYGEVTIGVETDSPKKISIEEFIQAYYSDNRTISVAKLEDESFLLSVENIVSTGRNPQSLMRLSKESLTGLVSTILLYLNIKGENMEELLKNATNGENIEYQYSDNISDIINKKFFNYKFMKKNYFHF